MPCRLATSAALQTGQLSDGGVTDEAIGLSILVAFCMSNILTRQFRTCEPCITCTAFGTLWGVYRFGEQ